MPAPPNEDRGTRRHAPDTACSRPNLAAVSGGVLRQLDVDRRRFHRRRAFSARALAQPRMGALFYCGNRFDYLYPPAMRYGAALISRYGSVSAARGYHIYSALLYCLSIAGVYALMRSVSRS